MKKKRFLWSMLIFILLLISCQSSTKQDFATGRKGMVVSVDPYASQIGIDILKKGGNAVDAAVAVGFVLGVTYPQAGNLGGGGFMIAWFPDTGEAVALDFREKAPGGATGSMYLDQNGNCVRELSDSGYLSCGVPGIIKGFELAMREYGKLSWQEVIGPAIELAEDGFKLSEKRARSFNSIKKSKRFKDAEELIRIFAKPDGSDFEEGDIFIQKDLAESLKMIASNGADAFYRGKIAELIALDMGKHGGLITRDDLEKYEALKRAPVRGEYHGYTILSMPPPSSGGTILIEMLNLLDGFDSVRMKRYSPQYIHIISEIMKFAYFDRAKYLGDTDFLDVPISRLISKEHAEIVRCKINPDKAMPSLEIGREILTLEKGSDTTHFSVIDSKGLAVAMTVTLNDHFGSGIIPKGTGIILNNEMADFNMKPGYTDDKGLIGTEPNLIKPYKRMLSSMTPTIVLKNGKAFLITGSPGGRTIMNTVLQVIINITDFKMKIQEAVDSPRIDHQWMPDIISMEKSDILTKAINSLEAMGHKVKIVPFQGDAHSILIDPQTGLYFGAADRRIDGSAKGY